MEAPSKKISVHPNTNIIKSGKVSYDTKNIKHKQQSSIASLKSRNPSNLPNVFTQSGIYLDFRISSDFDKIDKIDDIYLNMELKAVLNSRQETSSDNHYIVPGILINSTWLIDRVEFYVSGSLYDIQHAENLFMENCFKSNNELETEKNGAGMNSDYLEFNDNSNSIIYPSNTTYVPSLTAPTQDQRTVNNIPRTLRFGRNLVNKILLKAVNDEITIRVYFNNFTEINTPSISNFNSLNMTSCNIFMSGIKLSPSELQTQLLEKYIDKEYTFTSITRKYNSINFNNVTNGVKQSADIGNFAGTFNTFGVYLNYQNIVCQNFNQRTVTTGLTYTGVTPNRIPVPDDYSVTSVLKSNGLSYIKNQSSSYNPNYSQRPEIFELDITLQDGNGDSYPYERNISSQIIKNFSVNNNYSDFTKSFSIYPFNFGEHPNKDYTEQTIKSGHYVFDNSSTLIFTPLSPNVPSSCQLICVGTQLCQVAVKNGRIFFKYL